MSDCMSAQAKTCWQLSCLQQGRYSLFYQHRELQKQYGNWGKWARKKALHFGRSISNACRMCKSGRVSAHRIV